MEEADVVSSDNIVTPYKECIIQYHCIHSLRCGRTDRVFSDIMNLTDYSQVIPQQVKTCSGVYFAHGEYGYELGEINFG